MEENTERKSGKENNKIIYWAVIGALAVAVMVLAFFVFKLNSDVDEGWEALENKDAELELVSGKLDSIQTQLEERLLEIERLGGTGDSLRSVISQLEAEKKELRRKNGINYRRYKELKGKVTDYEKVIAEKDAEIEQLRAENNELKAENEEIRANRDSLGRELTDTDRERNALRNKMDEASVLNASRIKITALNKRGKERDGGEFKNKHIEKLKFDITIAQNKATNPGNKKIAVRVLTPDGTAVSDMALGGGSFEVNGQELFYTVAKDILYDNSQKQVKLFYKHSKEYKSGKYTVEVYTSRGVIGSSSFIVK